MCSRITASCAAGATAAALMLLLSISSPAAAQVALDSLKPGTKLRIHSVSGAPPLSARLENRDADVLLVRVAMVRAPGNDRGLPSGQVEPDTFRIEPLALRDIASLQAEVLRPRPGVKPAVVVSMGLIGALVGAVATFDVMASDDSQLTSGILVGTAAGVSLGALLGLARTPRLTWEDVVIEDARIVRSVHRP